MFESLVDLLGADVDEFSGACLCELLDGLDELADRVAAKRLQAAARCNAERGWAADGAYSGAGWLAARGRISRGEAAGLFRDATKLAAMPVASVAVYAGRLSARQGELLCGAVNARTRQRFAADEQLLVEVIAPLTVEESKSVIRYWLANADPDGPEPRDRDANGIWMSQRLSGRWDLKGDLDQESGTMWSGVLQQLADALFAARRDAGGDAPLASQLRAEALLEMARLAAAGGPATGVAPARPLLWVLAGTDQLESGKGVCQLVGGGPISALTAQRLRCDCDLVRVLWDADGHPQLDFGRSRRTATAGQRRALWVRDGGCVFPDCDRPPEWCEAHHLVWWDHGGPTDLGNLALICRHHHHLCHEGGWRIDRHPDTGRLRFHRPDGTQLHPAVIRT